MIKTLPVLSICAWIFVVHVCAQVTSTDTLHGALRSYRSGDYGAAFDALASMRPGDVIGSAQSLARQGAKMRDWQTVESLAALLLDAAIDATSRRVASGTLQTAAGLVADQAIDSGRRSDAMRDWYLLLDASAEGSWSFYDLEEHLAQAGKAFPQDTHILTASGSMYETRSRAPKRFIVLRAHPQQVVANYGERERRTDRDRARGFYEAALKADPTNEEAQLRLGRVLFERGDLARASQILASVAQSARRDDTRYLADLFLAAAAVEAGRTPEAKAAYLRAAEWNAEAPLMGLAALSLQAGATEEAQQALDRLYRSPPPDDPWQHYQKGQWRYLGDYRDRVRRAARR